jgi:hypothetical protein
MFDQFPRPPPIRVLVFALIALFSFIGLSVVNVIEADNSPPDVAITWHVSTFADMTRPAPMMSPADMRAMHRTRFRVIRRNHMALKPHWTKPEIIRQTYTG